MSLHFRAIFRIQGSLLKLMGAAMLLPLLVALHYQESSSALAFLVVAIPCFMVGQMATFFLRRGVIQIHMRDGLLTVALSWLLISAISAFPFMIQGCIPHFADAFFEAASGFTTTGATIVEDLDLLPRSMIFWRCLTHWFGGMGVLVLTIALLPKLGVSGQNVARAETPGPIFSKVTARMSQTARTLYLMYGVFTILETLLLRLGGMTWFEALCHTFGSVGTGGFGVYNDSIAHFNSLYIEVVLMVFMLLCGASFGLYYLVIINNPLDLLRDEEFRLYVGIFSSATALITITLYASGQASSLGAALRTAAFQVSSILTTTGFATTDYTTWPTFAMMVLLLLFFVGGCSSSTGGGIKVVRILVLFKALRSYIAAKLHPSAYMPIKVNDKRLTTELSSSITTFVFLYVSVIFLVGGVLTFSGVDIITSMTAAAACVGNVGPGFNLVGPSCNFAFFCAPCKLVLAVAMIAGRLELYTMLVLFSKHFWNPHKY